MFFTTDLNVILNGDHIIQKLMNKFVAGEITENVDWIRRARRPARLRVFVAAQASATARYSLSVTLI